MKLSRMDAVGAAFVLLSFGVAAALYGRLPESVPTHWNASGVADGFTPKPWGAFLMPLTMLGIWVLLLVLPRISPRGFRFDRFRGTWEILLAAIMAFFFLLTVLVLLAGTGAPLPMDRAIQAAAGLLFVVMGNFMGKVTKNFFVGVRTPWTLANDEVWLRTNRLAGKLFVLAGIVIFVSGLLGGGVPVLVGAAIVAAGIPAVYSYVIYRRIVGFKNGTS
ncbi:MAG TPA: SdpI family protein [Vulgatibacter sp.]